MPFYTKVYLTNLDAARRSGGMSSLNRVAALGAECKGWASAAKK